MKGSVRTIRRSYARVCGSITERASGEIAISRIQPSPHESLSLFGPFPTEGFIHVKPESGDVNRQVNPPLDQSRMETGRDQMQSEDHVGYDEISKLQQLRGGGEEKQGRIHGISHSQ